MEKIFNIFVSFEESLFLLFWYQFKHPSLLLFEDYAPLPPVSNATESKLTLTN